MSAPASLPNDDLPQEPVVTAQAPATPPPAGHASLAAQTLSRIVFGLLALVAFVALAIAIALWQKVGNIQEQLARQSGDALAQSLEARTLARQAQEIVRDTAARLALTEMRVAEVALQRAQLEELMQSMSRSRDENLVVDIESAVRLALQQAEVTGNTEPLLAALKAGAQRIARAAQPRLAPLQRALQRDADLIRSRANGDSGEALRKVDDLIRSVDDLPTINAVAAGRGGVKEWQSDAVPADAPWWRRVLLTVRGEARSLVRVGRIDQPEAMLLAPEQTYFLRENLKLKLLNLRLALLSREIDSARTELATVSTTLNRYFDPASRRTQAAATLLQQLNAQIKSTEPLRIDDTMTALATAAAGR
jgi:uroporphyrin-3 C-methyltransferase